MVARDDRRSDAHAARAGRAGHRRRHGSRRVPPRVRRPPEHHPAEPADGHGPPRRLPRHGRELADRRAGRGHARDLPRGRAPRMGCQPGRPSHAVPDHRGDRRGRESRAERDQPQPRRPGRRPAAAAGGARRGPPRLARRRGAGRGSLRRQSADVPRRRAARPHGRRDRPRGHRLRRHQRLGLERPLRARRPGRGRGARVGKSVGLQDGDRHQLRGGARLRCGRLDLDGTAGARPEPALPVARAAARGRSRGPTTRSTAMASSTCGRPSRLRRRPRIPSSRTTTSTWSGPTASSRRPRRR